MGTQKNIHPTAVIHPDVKLGSNVTVEAYAVLNSPYIELEDNVTIKSHVFIDGRVKIGQNTVIWPFASIGSQTQDLKYTGEITYVEIGQNCQIREYVTINSSCGEGSKVVVGNSCLIMAYCHVAHNCTVGDGVIMSNGATLAGHVTIGSHAVLGGVCAIHQRTRIGDFSMIGGGSMVGHDLPPYCMGTGFPLKVVGLNIIGLKRHKFPLTLRQQLIKLYRITYQKGKIWSEAKEEILQELPPNDYVQTWVDFWDSSSRGIAPLRDRKESLVSEEMEFVSIK